MSGLGAGKGLSFTMLRETVGGKTRLVPKKSVRRDRPKPTPRANISNGELKRLARRAGVTRLGKGVPEETRALLREFLTKVIRSAVTLVEHADRKTVSALDVVYGLKLNGISLVGF